MRPKVMLATIVMQLMLELQKPKRSIYNGIKYSNLGNIINNTNILLTKPRKYTQAFYICFNDSTFHG